MSSRAVDTTNFAHYGEWSLAESGHRTDQHGGLKYNFGPAADAENSQGCKKVRTGGTTDINGNESGTHFLRNPLG